MPLQDDRDGDAMGVDDDTAGGASGGSPAGAAGSSSAPSGGPGGAPIDESVIDALTRKVALLERELEVAHSILLQGQTGDAQLRRLWEIASRGHDLVLIFNLRVSGKAVRACGDGRPVVPPPRVASPALRFPAHSAGVAGCARLRLALVPHALLTSANPRSPHRRPPLPSSSSSPATPAGYDHVGVAVVRAPAGLPAVG